METGLFNDLLASAEEMVAIETGTAQATVTRELETQPTSLLNCKLFNGNGKRPVTH